MLTLGELYFLPSLILDFLNKSARVGLPSLGFRAGEGGREVVERSLTGRGGGRVTAKRLVVYCGRCHWETRHKRGRRGRWHCLRCGTENVQLRRTAEATGSLPPGFFIEAFPDGQLGLYMARAPANGKEYAWYIKGVFPADVPRSAILSRAWELQEARERAREVEAKALKRLQNSCEKRQDMP